ncbi:MAG: low affinity iron permease family protein, partial [Brevundimonas sp.]
FLIQNTQNRDGAAMQAKIDELIHAVGAADERFIGIERLTDKELRAILEKVEARAVRIRGDGLPVVATRHQDEDRKRKKLAMADTEDEAPKRKRKPAVLKPTKRKAPA